MKNTKFVVKVNRGGLGAAYVQRIDRTPIQTTTNRKLALIMGKFTAEDAIKAIPDFAVQSGVSFRDGSCVRLGIPLTRSPAGLASFSAKKNELPRRALLQVLRPQLKASFCSPPEPLRTLYGNLIGNYSLQLDRYGTRCTLLVESC